MFFYKFFKVKYVNYENNKGKLQNDLHLREKITAKLVKKWSLNKLCKKLWFYMKWIWKNQKQRILVSTIVVPSIQYIHTCLSRKFWHNASPNVDKLIGSSIWHYKRLKNIFHEWFVYVSDWLLLFKSTPKDSWVGYCVFSRVECRWTRERQWITLKRT